MGMGVPAMATCFACGARYEIAGGGAGQLALRSKPAPPSIAFDEVARTAEPMALHDVGGVAVLTWRGSLGVAGEPLAPIAVAGTEAESINAVYGRWPERVWASVNLGWEWSGVPGGPGTPVPTTAIVERDPDGAWIARDDLESIRGWPGAAIGVGRDGAARVLGIGGPPPTVDGEEIVPWTIQVAGDHAFARAGLVMITPWSHWWFPPGERAGRRLGFASDPPEHVWFAANDAGIYAVYPGFFGKLVDGQLLPLPQSLAGAPRILGFEHHLWVATNPPALYDGSRFVNPPLPGALAGFAAPWLVCATGRGHVLLRQRLASQPG